MNSIDDGNLSVESDGDEYASTVGGGNTGGMINVSWRNFCANAY